VSWSHDMSRGWFKKGLQKSVAGLGSNWSAHAQPRSIVALEGSQTRHIALTLLRHFT